METFSEKSSEQNMYTQDILCYSVKWIKTYLFDSWHLKTKCQIKHNDLFLLYLTFEYKVLDSLLMTYFILQDIYKNEDIKAIHFQVPVSRNKEDTHRLYAFHCKFSDLV